MSNPILILGASGGIGSAIARRLAAGGMPLLLHGRRRDRLEVLAADLARCSEVAVETADLTDPSQVGELFERLAKSHNKLGGLVFSVATPFRYRLAHRTPWTDIERQLNSQIKALHLAASACFPLLADSGTAKRLVVIGTEAVLGMPPMKMSAYAAAKAALTAYAQVIAQEWLGRGVRVHIVAPGLVKTELMADLPDAYLESLAEQMPEKRLTSAADVAAFVNFLFTDAADPLYGMPLQLSRGVRR